MRKWIAASVCAFAVGLAAAPASAEDFTITVPLEMSNLPPNIQAVLYACRVSTASGADVGIGRGRAEVRDGAVRGPVVVAFDAQAGRDPATATHYECTAWFVGTERGATVHYMENRSSPTFPLTAGAPLRLTTGRRALP